MGKGWVEWVWGGLSGGGWVQWRGEDLVQGEGGWFSGGGGAVSSSGGWGGFKCKFKWGGGVSGFRWWVVGRVVNSCGVGFSMEGWRVCSDGGCSGGGGWC